MTSHFVAMPTAVISGGVATKLIIAAENAERQPVAKLHQCGEDEIRHDDQQREHAVDRDERHGLCRTAQHMAQAGHGREGRHGFRLGSIARLPCGQGADRAQVIQILDRDAQETRILA